MRFYVSEEWKQFEEGREKYLKDFIAIEKNRIALHQKGVRDCRQEIKEWLERKKTHPNQSGMDKAFLEMGLRFSRKWLVRHKENVKVGKQRLAEWQDVYKKWQEDQKPVVEKVKTSAPHLTLIRGGLYGAG